ncbi:hypothetical protein PG989_011809 [Apiospora arundinis]
MSEATPTAGSPQIINAGLFKMGTRSMAEAYKILGYRTHHGMDDVWGGNPWEGMERGAEATWPAFANPGKKAAAEKPPARFTREQWDEVWGGWDAITDVASPFTEELIQIYPDAKVVVVQRDFNTWWPSLKTGVLDPIFDWTFDMMLLVIAIPPVTASRAMMRGFFGATRGADIDEQMARDGYDRYYRRVRELLPEEGPGSRRLEYKMGSGWEPLCAFLGKEVPDVPFPRVNEAEQFTKDRIKEYNVTVQKTWAAIKPWAFTALSVGVVAAAIKYRYYRA